MFEYLNLHTSRQTGSRANMAHATSLGSALMGTQFGEKFRDFPDVDAFPLHVLPFPVSLYPRVESHFALPRATPELLTSRDTHSHFQAYQTETWVGFTLCLPSRGIIDLHMCASISWRPEKGTVGVLIQGCTSQQQGRIGRRLEELSVFAFHPLLLPTIAVELKTECLHEEEVDLWKSLVTVEDLSKQTATPVVPRMQQYLHAEPPLQPRQKLSQSCYGAPKSTRARDTDQVVHRGRVPLPHDCERASADTVETPLSNDVVTHQEAFDSKGDEVTIPVLGVLQRTSYAESHVKSLLLAIDGIRKGIKTVSDTAKDHDRDGAEYITSAGEMLAEKLDFVEYKIKAIMANITFVEKRAQAQQAAVCNPFFLSPIVSLFSSL